MAADCHKRFAAPKKGTPGSGSAMSAPSSVSPVPIRGAAQDARADRKIATKPLLMGARRAANRTGQAFAFVEIWLSGLYGLLRFSDEMCCPRVHLHLMFIAQAFEEEIEDQWIALPTVKNFSLQSSRLIF